MLIIGFGHRARQGKNTAAVAVLNASPVAMRGRIYAYADALRSEVKKAIAQYGGLEQLIETWRTVPLFGVELPSWVVAETGKPRSLLQWWGTDFRRKQDVNYWVKQLAERLEQEQPDLALITDVRFPNEVEAIHAVGGVAVRVVRTTAPDIKVAEHESESALDGFQGWDYTLTAADLPELRKKAAALYTKIAGTR